VESVSKLESQNQSVAHQLMKKPKKFPIFQKRVDFMQCFIMLNHITFSPEIKNA
jgi:hypothetical protein